MTAVEDRLVSLYAEIAELTKPECMEKCHRAGSCCDKSYCDFTVKYAADEWGVALEATDHPDLPLMGPDGCTAAPHLRPLCSVHTCEVASLGYKRGDEEWTLEYFRLRDLIDELETERSL